MTEASGWAFTICSGALVCGIVSALIPGKAYEGAIQLLLGLFMLFCFLSPVSLHWSWPEVDLEKAEEKRLEVAQGTEQQLSAQIKRDSSRQLMEVAAKALKPFDLQADELGIALEVEGEQPYAAVTLPIRLRERHSSMTRLLEQELGIPVKISYEAAPS